MDLLKAFDKRESLTDSELERLIQRLRTEVTHHERAIANYPEDRMEKYGTPYLLRLQDRVAEAEKTLARREVK